MQLWKSCKEGYGKIIKAFPKVLVTMLKRYSSSDGKEQKNMSHINISHVVDLHEHSSEVKSDHVLSKCKEKKDAENGCSLFVLRAVVAHHGSSLDAGHYSTIIYIKEDIMLTLDGSCIQQTTITEKDRLLSDAYIIIYERADVIADLEKNYFALLPIISSKISSSRICGIFKRLEAEHRKWKIELKPSESHSILKILARELS